MPPPRSAQRLAPNTPMSERQQMALLMQMTSTSPSSSSAEMSPGSTSHAAPARRERNERGETALHVAAIKGDQESVKKLLDSGMSPNVTDFANWTPLHEACNYQHFHVACILVKAGANVNAKGLDDDTPLHDAAVVGHLKLVKMLVEKGADPHFKNRKGKSPLDVAHTSVLQYLQSLKEPAPTRSIQGKKAAEAKNKNAEESDDSTGQIGGSQNKQEEDIYEFKSTPKDSAGHEEKPDLRKTDRRSKSEEEPTEESSTANASNNHSSSSGNANNQSGGASTTGGSNTSSSTSTKRTFSDVEGTADENQTEADDNKRKKRKDSENVKDSIKPSSLRNLNQRQNAKLAGGANKSAGSISSKISTNIDRKSPCASPKPASRTTDSDIEGEDAKSSDNFSVSAGPKVPPLKIVIPQQNSNTDNETGSRNGKNNSVRNHPALPYVVASSSSNSNDSVTADRESTSSRCASPADSTGCKSTNVSEDKKATSEERAQQRVLRSSHRSGGQNVDRGSNNSSPQLQSSSPSPAAPCENNEANSAASSGKASSSAASSSSPAVQNQNETDESASSSSSTKEAQQNTELHPRKRKIRAKQEENTNKTATATATTSSQANTNESQVVSEVHPHDHPFTNCYQMYLNIRKQIEKKHRSLIPITPRPPQGFKDYLLNRRSYALSGKTQEEPTVIYPEKLPQLMKELFSTQEKERYKLKIQHIVEKEKLGLAVEQEILRVHAKAARSLACQSIPFSACTLFKDEEIYNIITPEQEEKDRNARSRYNGRLFLSWLQDVDDKWEKIKDAMVLRHHNEAESLHAIQKMDWEWAMKEHLLCDYKSQPVIEDKFVPIVHVSDDFDLLPA